MGEVRQRDDGAFGDAQQFGQHVARLAHLRQSLGKHGVVESAGGEVVEIVVGVALHDRQAPRQAGRDALGAEFEPPSVDVLLAPEQL